MKKEYRKPEFQVAVLAAEDICASGVPQPGQVSATITISSDDWVSDDGVVDIF